MDRITQLKGLLLKEEDDPFLNHALALEYIKEGNDVEARLLFEKILHHHPGYVGSYYHLAKLLERSHEREKALYWYEKGMQAATSAGNNHALNELRMAYEDLADS
jgi:Tfp pilus assembly protein PilF